ncbi:hypothetical protein GGS21DRAFT_509857 [Xylaria nigripes]|nr:hypothetical protein GGS21DRAFT_509857 [Xylaria nigripes]
MMTPPEPSNAEARQRIAKLRELLQQPSSKDKVAPLVTALMARDVDLHERMLTDLSIKVQQIEAAGKSKDTSCLSERMHSIEQDAKSLRQLITEVDQNVVDTKADQNQLKVELAKAVDQNYSRIANVEQHLKIIGEAMEQRQRTSDEIMDILDAMVKNRQRLQRHINQTRNGLKGLQTDTPLADNITRLIGLMTEYLDQTSFISDIKHKQDTSEKSTRNMPACKGPPGDVKDPSKGPNQSQLHEFPAITEFLVVYDKFIETYKSTRPANEADFITNFLNSLNVHVSCAVQRQLLQIYPKKVVLAATCTGEQSPKIFIDLDRIDWKTIRRAIPKIKDLRVLQWAFNNGLSGPALNPIS